MLTYFPLKMTPSDIPNSSREDQQGRRSFDCIRPPAVDYPLNCRVRDEWSTVEISQRGTRLLMLTFIMSNWRAFSSLTSSRMSSTVKSRGMATCLHGWEVSKGHAIITWLTCRYTSWNHTFASGSWVGVEVHPSADGCVSSPYVCDRLHVDEWFAKEI